MINEGIDIQESSKGCRPSCYPTMCAEAAGSNGAVQHSQFISWSFFVLAFFDAAGQFHD